MSPLRLPSLIVILLLVAGCSLMGNSSGEQLDQQTGVTLSRADKPLILYRDGSARAAHARDYIYLGPIQVNRMGDLRYYLWLGIWSTIPTADPAAQRDGFESITLFADGEPLQLSNAGWLPGAIGASRSVYVRPVASAADAYYEVTIDQVRLIAGADDLRILTSGTIGGEYNLWSRQNAAFVAFDQFVQRAIP